MQGQPRPLLAQAQRLAQRPAAPAPAPEHARARGHLVRITVGNVTVTVEASRAARFQAGTYGSVWRVQVQPSGMPAVMKVVLTRKRHQSTAMMAAYGTPAEKEVAMGQRLLQLQARHDAALQQPPQRAWWQLPWRQHSGSSSADDATPWSNELEMLQHTVRVLAAGEVSSADVNALRGWLPSTNVTATAVVMAPLAYTVDDQYKKKGTISGAEWREIMSSAARANVAFLKAGLVYTDSKLRNLMRDAATGTWKYIDIGAFETVKLLGLNNTVASVQWTAKLPTNLVRDANGVKVQMTSVPPRILRVAARAAAAV